MRQKGLISGGARTVANFRITNRIVTIRGYGVYIKCPAISAIKHKIGAKNATNFVLVATEDLKHNKLHNKFRSEADYVAQGAKLFRVNPYHSHSSIS